MKVSASVPEEKSERESPVERLWERNREGRKETYRKPSTENGKRSTGNQVERNGKKQKVERQKLQLESHCEAGKQRTGTEETEAE